MLCFSFPPNAFFFLLGKLIWASKIKSSVLGPKSHKSIWAKFFFSIVVQQTTFQLPNLGLWTDTYTRINSPLNQPKHIRINSPKINISDGLFKGVKREKRARAHAAESFATYPSRLSHTCTCLFSLQIITEKIEPESLENAEIRFMSSWSFIYLSACSGTRLIHIYLWFMQIWFMQLILIYMQCSFHGCIHL